MTTEAFCDQRTPETTPNDICEVYLDARIPGLAFVYFIVTPLGKKNLNEEASDVKPTLLYRFEEEKMLNQTPIKSVRMQTDAKIQIG